MVFVGLISYPLYLWHWPILSFARIVEGEMPSREIRMGAVALSLVLAWLTYRLIEKPIRFGKNTWIKTAALSMALVLVAYVGYNAFKRDGLNFRLDSSKPLNKIIFVPYPPLKQKFDCGKHIPEFKYFVFDGNCLLSKDELPTVIFVGDSHAGQFRNAVFDKFTADAVLHVVQTSCLPFSSDAFLTGECKRKYNAIIEFLEKNRSVKDVFLSGYWAYLMSGGFDKQGPNWRNAKTLSEEDKLTFKKNASEFISRVSATGKRVILLKDIPDLDFDIRLCFDIRPLRITPAKIQHNCSMNEANYIQRRASYDLVIDELLLSFPNVVSYNPVPLFCKNGKCAAKDSLLPYYMNGDHVNHFGASLVINGLIDELAKIRK